MKKRLLTFFGVAIGLSVSAASAEPPEFASPPLFAGHETLEVQIEGPLRTLMRERSNTDYYDGKFRYRQLDGTDREFDLKFRTRGNYRRRSETCRFPPVRLNFKKKQLAGSLLEGQNTLKLVTHCKPRSGAFEQLVLKEFLAYRILEQHTPYSFRTRLLKITWIDTDDKNKSDIRYGFMIEDKDELAARLGVQVAEIQGTRYAMLDKHRSSVAAVFQYLIGNTDFSMVAGPKDDDCCHNATLLTGEDGKYIPVPYDFDFSGLVNAPYAGPNPRFKIKSVTTRLYRGDCELNGEVERSVALFLENRNAVEQIIENQEGLSNTSRRRARAFVARFYETISNPQRVETIFIKGCS